jgi:hypothetical protein
MARIHRRDFLERALSLPALLSLQPSPAVPSLADRFPDLSRRFVFEYYPWYGRDPWRHWNEAGRRPPDDLATEYFPRLGAYDSRSRAVIEQHARWIAASGASSISLSWWGNGNYEDRAVDDVMDVMKDHGIAVAFGLEPYVNDRGFRFANDILYLLTKYGERRGWDAFLILRNEDGSESPVFKGFRCILPETFVDCHGTTREVPDYTPDALWRRQIDFLRRELRWDFERVFLLADSLDFGRTPASGFDGIAIYDNFLPPEQYLPLARGASRADLLFSFNVNPGYDEILQQYVAPDSCYEPRAFAPPTEPLDFERFDHRERAAELSADRIRSSLAATIEAQSDPTLSNFRRGFFLAYINSFNEWHEGHAFEPMKDDIDLTSEERLHGYHNPTFGDYRLATLTEALRPLLTRERGRAGGDTGEFRDPRVLAIDSSEAPSTEPARRTGAIGSARGGASSRVRARLGLARW